MQELRSTEILDKEIQNDARKKAENILKKADAECERIIASVETDIAQEEKEKKHFFEQKLKTFIDDRNVSLPLEKQRLEVSFVQKKMLENINKYLSALSNEKRLELVLKKLSVEVLKGKELIAYVYGFKIDDVSSYLKNRFTLSVVKYENTEFGKIVPEEYFNGMIENLEGIIFEAEDRSARYRFTVSEAVEKLLDEHREELSKILFS